MSIERCAFIVSVEKGKRGYGKADTGMRIDGNQFMLEGKNRAAVNSFLGTSRRTSKTTTFPAYYGELLAWALKRHMERQCWRIVRVLGYRSGEPRYADACTDYHEIERVLVDGQLLIDNDGHRLAVTVDIKACSRSLVMVEGGTNEKREIKEFADGVQAIVEKENYYKGKRLEFNGYIRFRDIGDEPWGNINLAPALKAQIKAGTIDLLDNKQTWSKYGIPLKRCVLLVGGVREDKSAICQALVTEAVGITCIIANSCGLDYDCVAQLYHLARDLSPCIVFIEDVDRMGRNRIKSDYRKESGLISLLTLLGNVEEHEGIVTVATADYFDFLGKAMLG